MRGLTSAERIAIENDLRWPDQVSTFRDGAEEALYDGLVRRGLMRVEQWDEPLPPQEENGVIYDRWIEHRTYQTTDQGKLALRLDAAARL
jgi:hypothetical protein